MLQKTPMRLNIRQIRKKQNMTIAQLADAIDKTPGYVSQLERGVNDKKPSTNLLEAIASALNVPAHVLIRDPVAIPVVGKVGAGASVMLIDAFAKGDGMYFVEAPDDLGPGAFVAVEVEGDSMDPLIQAGDVLFFARTTLGVPDEAVNRVCVLETAAGEALVKQIKPGREPRTWDLHSANHTTDPIWGARLQWASPLRRHLPAMDVVRVDRTT